MLKNYKELKVWQKSYQLCLEIYKITAKFPKDEKFGLTSQIRRAVVSVSSNIAEGYGRKTTADYIKSLYMVHLPKSWSMKRIQGVKDSRIQAKKDLFLHLTPGILESLTPFSQLYILPMDQTVNWKRR